MAEKLYDSNTSFGVLRTNPRLTGNFKITLDSSGGVWFNSMNSSPELSLQKYKKFRITGNNTYAKDIYNFFDEGSVSNEIVFQVAKNTKGETQAAETFAQQYDFFYGAGASTLIDKNYDESFSYFQPLWVRDLLPDFFVIFKVPEPLSYPYPTNTTVIENGVQYKVLQSSQIYGAPFIIEYWNTTTNSFKRYSAGEFFEGNSVFSTYEVIQGTGVVTEMNELKYYDEVNDVQSFFNSKILPYAQVVSTFDLRSNTTIGKYIRSIINNPGFSQTPFDFSLQSNTFSYYNGVSVSQGVFTRKGEFLNSYLTSNQSTSQIDFEEYITDGFSRNGIICPNLLNLEFLFDDPDSDVYTINRYLGFYVSRNDLGEFKLNGNFFYEFRNDSNNLNLPKPTRNNLGYYYNQSPSYQSSTGGVRLYYEGASGWMPGSVDVNVLDPQKLYYITDKEERFYSLSRYENYVAGSFLNNTPDYLQFGPYYLNVKNIEKVYSLWNPLAEAYLNTTVVTEGNHEFENNSVVTITGSSQEIDGSWVITIPEGATGNSFQIPVVLTGGSGVVIGSTGYISGATASYVDPTFWTDQKAAGGFFFGTTGSTGTETGSLVIADKKINLSDFTGPDEMVGSYPGLITGEKGRAYADITFKKTLDLDKPVTFKIFWPNGSRGSLNQKYDLVTSGDYAGTLSGWTKGSFYSAGNNNYFNWFQGDVSDFSKAFNGAVSSISTVVWDTGSSEGTSIIRIKNPGQNSNSQFSITVFSDYETFESNYQGLWNNNSAYSPGNIVVYGGRYYELVSSVSYNPYGPNLSPSESSSWIDYYPFSYSGYVDIEGTDASTISSIKGFVGGTDYSKNRVAFPITEAGNVKEGNWIQVEPGKGITGGLSLISSVTRFVDLPTYDNDPLSKTGTVTGFKGFNEYLVANLSNNNAVINLGSNSRFNVFNMTTLYTGVFSFFDVKDFNFDFWSSSYGITPTPEFHRYFQLIPDQEDQIVPGQKYYVKRGSISYRANNFPVINNTVTQGQIFITTFATSFRDLLLNGQSAIVLPAAFTRVLYQNAVGYASPPANYGTLVPSEQDLNNFDGFYGIQSINTEDVVDENVKQTVFEYGKLDTEYEYLEENYTVTRANKSRIVPYINKWGYRGGTDARGNQYRLNVSPAFSSTNFSPGFQQDVPNPDYLTHEWMILEGVPRQYPSSSIPSQNNYLPEKVNIDRIRNASPSEMDYFTDRFTVDPSEYPSPYTNLTGEVKEFFTPFFYNSTTGFYETVFRGIKISLERRSTQPNPQTDSEKFVKGFRGFEGYNFSAILRVVPEDNTTVQPPVTYEVIENVTQKCILFITYAVIKDYRVLPLGYTGPTGSDPYLDYLLMYSLQSKKKLDLVGPTANFVPLYSISDIKLSAALDLSFSSSSNCNSTSNGQIYIIPNSDYDTDLREEINLFYPLGSTAGVFPATGGSGSFVALASSSQTSLYPWPIGRSQNLIDFGPTNPTNYYFEIPFAPTPSPVLDIPVGSQAAYAGKPVTQLGGGENYFRFLMKRLSLSHIANKVNTESPYIKYKTYIYNEVTSETDLIENYFELSFIQPTAIYKSSGVVPVKSYTGPKTLGGNQPTGYEIVNGGPSLASDILRYSGGYEPLFNKVILFKGDKDDTVSGNPSVDLSYRNCTFAPEKTGFGLIDNLNYTKVSLGKNILEASQNLLQGPVYPLIGQTPIAKKNLSVFLSTWDPGYYNLYSSSIDQTPVAGTRSMLELKNFFGSKVMQTPGDITTYTFITLEISKTQGVLNPQSINAEARASLSSIQSMSPSQSGTGIGQLGPALSGVDLSKLDESIYPDVEVFWQYDSITRIIYGVIRLDRILTRYLLNSGIENVFIQNIISEYGVGDPNSIQDDVIAYIQQNIVPAYEGKNLDLLVLKRGTPLTGSGRAIPPKLVTGDLVSPDKVKYGYAPQPNFSLTQRTALTYQFEYILEPNQNYSLTFNFRTGKI
jgi:hypothetical protein